MNQSQIECLIHPKHIKEDIKKEIIEYMSDSIITSVNGIKNWIEITEWDSKNVRKEQLAQVDLHGLVADILTTVTMSCVKPLPLVSLASMINISVFEDKLDSIKTVCELIGLLESLNVYELTRTVSNSITITSLLEPSEAVLNRLNLYCYLPPMIEKPYVLTDNMSCGYKTISKDSLILGGSINRHKDDICLDVLNTQNSNKYELDMWFINTYSKEWGKELNQEELSKLSMLEQSDYKIQKETWEEYQVQFNTLVPHLVDKTLYFTHKVDKRGRLYCMGYHFSSQGTSFEKACLNLNHKELITGDL